MTTRPMRRRRQLLTPEDYVRAGLAQVVNPSTEAGWVSYGIGRWFPPVGINYCGDPSFELDTNADGLADGWIILKSVVGTPVTTLVAGLDSPRAQRITYTGVPGDSGGTIQLNYMTANSTFAATEPCTVSVAIKGTIGGATANIHVQGFKNDDTYVADSSTGVSPTATWARATRTYTSLWTNTAKVRMAVSVDGIHNGDVVDITIDDAMIEKALTSSLAYFDGSYSGCSWAGTPHASQSTRIAGSLIWAGIASIDSTGVTALGGQTIYRRNASEYYFGPVVVAAAGYTAAEQAALVANWNNPVALLNLVKAGDYLIPLVSDSRAYKKKPDVTTLPTFMHTNSNLATITGDLPTIKALGVNIVHNYVQRTMTTGQMTAWLDALYAVGLQALVNVEHLGQLIIIGRGSPTTLTTAEVAALAAYINTWKTHPAVWGWYATDEGYGYNVPAGEQVYGTIKAADPIHPVVEAFTNPSTIPGGAGNPYYSPTTHDIVMLDSGAGYYAYVYFYDDQTGSHYGCISKATGLVTNEANETEALSRFQTNLGTIKANLNAAGDTNIVVAIQTFGQGAAGDTYSFAMPPSGGITKMWEAVKAAGLNAHGVGFWLWHSEDSTTMTAEQLIGVKGAAYAAQRAEIAAVAAEAPA